MGFSVKDKTYYWYQSENSHWAYQALQYYFKVSKNNETLSGKFKDYFSVLDIDYVKVTEEAIQEQILNPQKYFNLPAA